MIAELDIAQPLVVHANFADPDLVIWAESAALHAGQDHPFAVPAEALEPLRLRLGVGVDQVERTEVVLRLPVVDGAALRSAPLAHELGQEAAEAGVEVGLAEVRVPGLRVPSSVWASALEALVELGDREDGERVILGPGVEHFAMLARLGTRLLVQQRFVPMVCQEPAGQLTAAWWPWLADEATASGVAAIVRAGPPITRAVVDDLAHDPWQIAEAFLARQVDHVCRRVLLDDTMNEVVEDLDPTADGQIAWATGLLTESPDVAASPAHKTDVTRRVRRWIASLEDRGKSSSWRLLLRLNEPITEAEETDDTETATIEAPSDDLLWSVSFHLQSLDNSEVIVDAADVWLLNRDSISIQGLMLESPQELLLSELGRAARIFKKLEGALEESEPVDVTLATKDAYTFLREMRPLLLEQGFSVDSPGWWESQAARLGTKLKIESESIEALMDAGASASGGTGPQLGLSSLVGYHWEIAIGDTTLTLNEFEQLASKGSPLVQINGKWVEIRPEDVKAAVRFISENPGGEIKLAEAIRLAYAADSKQTGVPVLGLDATGWVSSLFGGPSDGPSLKVSEQIPLLETPEGFKGTLRPYQLRGLSWLSFLERFGFGACLADDMGLGKTIQLLALMAHEREEAARNGGTVRPTLLVVPMSVVGNWLREAKKFTPDLKVVIHHGVDRKQGDDLIEAAVNCDAMITTYALAHRDRETLQLIQWGRLVVDEAQFIKNPTAKQAMAVRALDAERRVALTGTPVENRLSELWSIIDFLNPGYLGSSGNFRKRFSVPIERYRDQVRSRQLRGLVRPFILRRVKTDPTVVADLPEKLETKEYTHLTSEQASLYESCVKRMLADVDQSDGIHRRGLVLAALIRLKQICNHPSQILKDVDFSAGQAPDASRSGKATRMMEMVDEVLAEGEKALVFTQFRQMGHLLASMLRHQMGREVLFLHGGTPQGAREKMVEQFQDPKSGKPILILSLKAGGVGLNLTAATHVFHYDRWWNPAVENQATDRAYRIGQTRTVHVHKFVVRGTLEERIDEMIESKTELAENIIGQGERWLTELDSDQLREILALRADAVGDEE